MKKLLDLGKQVLFVFLSFIWVSAFSYFVYVGYRWDCEQQAISEQYYGPEAYYP